VRIIVEKNVMVSMHDGVALATDIYRPEGGDPFPTLVRRTPYDKEDLREFTEPGIMRAVQAGYAVVVQDTRGCGLSEGTFHPFASEASDGAETIAWAAGQSWSTGMIGTIGDSYLGMTQWHAATASPPALRAMAPSLAVADYYQGWVYQGGAFSLGFSLIWALHHLAPAEIRRRMARGAATAEDLDALVSAIDDTTGLYSRLPPMDMPELRAVAPYYREWLAHPSYDEHWRALSPRERIGAIGVPAFHVAGWYDLFLGGTLSGYSSLREHGGTAMARVAQRLLIGPWTHGWLDGAYP
jgi:putative CocE/NonD family hydrolase